MIRTRSLTVAPAARRHTPLAAVDPYGRRAVLAAGRADDIPGRRPVRLVTFDSAV
ncbi:hypothetical protein [Streptomyces sp. NPDC127072]|uniref:hypothetical protein n=1 Tax=Streptomyces sp. NPDC127072 TaxID=3347129 RepID=UPI00364C05A7